MKKVLLVVMCLMLAFAAVACSNNDAADTPNEPETNNEATENESTEPQSITVGRWGGNDAETAAFAALLAAFTEATGIEVTEKVYTDYQTELFAEFVGGTAPDVFYVDAYAAPYFIQEEVLAPLDSATFELDKFYAPLVDAFAKDGVNYGVPKDFSTLALYYNKAYINEEDIPATLEEFWADGGFLDQVQATLPEGMIAMTYNADLARNMFLAEATGVSIIKDGMYSNVADPEIIDNLTPLYDAAISGKILRPQDLGQGWNGDAFGNQTTAMMIEGNWTLGHLQQNFPDVEFGVVEIPTFKGAQGSMTFTVAWGMNAATENETAAAEFIKFVSGEGLSIWTEGAGVLPPRADVAEETMVAEDEYKAAHVAAAAYATSWTGSTTLGTISLGYGNYIPSVAKGDRTLEDALTMAQEEANSDIEANQ